jgi:hypothetical protein
LKAKFNNFFFIYLGSGSSHTNPDGYLPKHVYLTIDLEKKSFLKEAAANEAIFQVFCHYESFKVKKRA